MASHSGRALVQITRAASLRSDCLPFLYCTPTILAPRFQRRLAIRQSCHPFTSHQARNQHDLHHNSRHDIPFQNLHDYDVEEAPKPDSTLTLQERRAFEKLRQKESSDEIEDDDELHKNSGGAYDDLHQIFDTLIRLQDTHQTNREEKLEKHVLRYEGKENPFAPTLLSTLSKTGDRDTGRLRVRDGKIVRERELAEDHAEITKTCHEHLRRTQARLDAATTDVAIWNALEQELFSVVRTFNERLEMEQRNLDPKLKTKNKTSRIKTKRKAAFSGSSSIASDRASSHSHEQLTTNLLLAIIQENYANVILKALRFWRQRFALTPYSLQILPHIKSLGNISYVLGASTGMYNEILFVKWTQYHDLNGIADLILEMVNQGLGVSQLTFELVDSISRTRSRDLTGQRGKVLRSWWILRGTKEAWMRLRSIYKQLQQEAAKPVNTTDRRLRDALDTQGYGELGESHRISGT